MEIPKPQVRECVECRNTFALNLFRQDQSICRYCESGTKPPIKLIQRSKYSNNTTVVQDNQSIVKNTESDFQKENLIMTNEYTKDTLYRDKDNKALETYMSENIGSLKNNENKDG